MSIYEAAEQAGRGAVGWLRQTQDSEGWWMGCLRSTYSLWYAAGLALNQEPPGSPVIQDICDYVEDCATTEGGLGPYPGEAATGLETSLGMSLLQWARPGSTALAEAGRYLKRNRQYYRDLSASLFRWAFEPSAHAGLLADRGPPNLLRRAALLASRRHPSQRWSLAEMFPRHYRQPSLITRLAEPVLMRALSFPPTGRLEEAARSCPLPTGFDFTLLTYVALRRLAGDRASIAGPLYEFALKRRNRFVYQDGSYEWLSTIIADLLFTETFGLKEERRQAELALGKIAYAKGGWLRGGPISINIFDTALTVLALRAAGIPEGDPIISQARAFLRQARSPVHGMWSWTYYQGMGESRSYLDTDDTGAACMALAACGEPAGSAVLRSAVNGLRTMQESSGAFSTFGDGVLRPNWCWVSNTSRALQALLMGGLSGEHEAVRRAATWLLSQQRADGSWVDGWCARYIYGTVIALEALLRSSGLRAGDPETVLAVDWLLKEQNCDGGWGEDWRGARSRSTAEHTGLALYALCLASRPGARPIDAIGAGVKWLIQHQRSDGAWDASYFVNFGFGVGFANSQLPVVWALHGLAQAIKVLARAQTSNVEFNQLSSLLAVSSGSSSTYSVA